MSAVKVAYILTPVSFGGAEKVSLNFLRAVDRSQFDIRPVLLLRPWEEPPHFAREIRDLGFDYLPVPVSSKPGHDPLRVLRVCLRLYRFIRRGGFQLVHTHGYFADICTLPLTKLLGIPSVSTCHGFIGNDRNLRIYNALDRFALALSDKIIAVSEGIRGRLVDSGLKDQRITVVPNAVSTTADRERLLPRREVQRRRLGIADGELVIGYVGRLSEEKGLSFLVGALCQLQAAGTSVKLLLVGDGEERQRLAAQTSAAGLADRVVFAGFQTDVEDWLAAFDLFVLPSLTEGTPLALLEAMAAGLPVVATAVGGIPGIINDGENGFLVPAADVEALREKLERLLRDVNLRESLGRAGCETVRARYGQESWVAQMQEIYRQCNREPVG